MRHVHWFDFTTYVRKNGDLLPVRVEVTLSSDHLNNVEIEGVKVKLSEGDTELVLSDEQNKDILIEAWEKINYDNVVDEPGADWRNEWE